MKSSFLPVALLCFASITVVAGRDFHVAVGGDDAAEGFAESPLRTIQRAADLAMPGDVVTVHAGVYRERVNPPRGGESDARRIIYQAAPGGQVAIKGSEVVRGWKKLGPDIWQVVLENGFFGGFNPFADEIRGDWFKPLGRKHHTGAVYLNGHWLVEAATLEQVSDPAAKEPHWFATVDDNQTTITARFPDIDPNLEGIEINVRQAVFYPEETGRDFITVRGFTLEHAATNWAPPTAEQVGLIGTHWSKGWVIERNTIRYSTCSGVTLGKHGDELDNTSADSAEGYVETIKRGLANGWSKENIGHHVVRDNHISHCEQTGICGSLGAAFGSITGNHIHDIHVRRLFAGAEQAGIKIHAAIDMRIAGNHIHRCNRGIWLDWMAQGARVTGNLLHDNIASEDLFLEVNHGPCVIDHNLLLSPRSLADWSQGTAFAHNLFAGKIVPRAELRRETPWLAEHGTAIAGLSVTQGGDNRFINNLFIGPAGLDGYDAAARPVVFHGNLFLAGAKASVHEAVARVFPDANPGLDLLEKDSEWRLSMTMEPAWYAGTKREIVTTASLGKAAVPGLAYVRPDGAPLRLDADYFGRSHDSDNPGCGPFASPPGGNASLRLWPLSRNDESPDAGQTYRSVNPFRAP